MTALGKYPLQLNKFASIMYNNSQKKITEPWSQVQQLCIAIVIESAHNHVCLLETLVSRDTGVGDC